MEAGKFTNYFLAYVKPEEIPQDPDEKRKFLFGRPGVLELCQYGRAPVYMPAPGGQSHQRAARASSSLRKPVGSNWGTESDPNFAGYHNGNKDPRGFGHICVAVPDLDAACARFEALGVTFQKRPQDGTG